MKSAWAFAVTMAVCFHAAAQAPDVPVYKQGRRESEYDDGISKAARELFAGTNAAKLALVKEQLKRPSCELDLPKANTKRHLLGKFCDVTGHLPSYPSSQAW